MSLPQLDSFEGLRDDYRYFVQVLSGCGFEGDIETSYAGRLVASTDNSIYQQLPQAVLHPRTQQDVGRIFALAAKAEHQSIRFSPRGGGTGTNGQSLTAWLVIDLSRYLTRILELNLQEQWVRVETGLVKDALNSELAKHGYFFAPDTSTSNRATIGGMINTDASGQGSLVYGKTSNHILGLSSYLLNGERLESAPVSLADARALAERQLPHSALYQQVIASCVDKRAEIEARFPDLNRFLTGYDLKHAYAPDTQTIDLSRLIAGSEGTLAVVTEARLKITPIPRQKVLVNVKYSDFQAALRHAPTLVKANATSVETIDSKVLNLARQDIVWHGVSELITDDPAQPMDGLNMVEINAVEEETMATRLFQLRALLDQAIGETGNGVIGYQICDDLDSIGRIYAMRKKAVGLLGATKGRAKPIAFVEDTAVPPENLADFIAEFRQLLDSYGLAYGMFGHVDAGVLHVRPALDMQSEPEEALVRILSDKVMALTAKYGGLLWGEHGKGYRSEYGPEFFGSELFTELRRIKGVFDPDNRLNPGKICTPLNSEESLVTVDDQKRGWFDKQIPLHVQQSYQQAMDCNGNGLCFNFDANTPMCPSYRVTGDRVHSPKGRATLIREWLRLTELSGYNASGVARPATVLKRWWRSRDQGNDFNHEVKASMDNCLACKACSSQCPVKVDIPQHRARFLSHYYSRYRRPLRDYAVKNIERLGPLMLRAPRLFNALSHNPVSQVMVKGLLKMSDMPRLSVPALSQRLQHLKVVSWHAFQQSRKNEVAEKGNNYVALVQDPFTTLYEAQLVTDFIKVCNKLGLTVVLLPLRPNGKPTHVKGFLTDFEHIAQQQADFLNEVSAQGLPLVGLDASTVLCYRDEYRQALGDKRGEFDVMMLHEWLEPCVAGQAARFSSQSAKPLQLLPHCTEQTADADVGKAWSRIFAHLGATVETKAVGCCGMAGTYGHETEHQQHSQALFEMSWKAALSTATKPMATGFSCRCQAERFAHRSLPHPVQSLLSLLE